MPVKDKKVTLKKKNVSNTGAKNKKSQKKLKAPVKKKLSDKTSSKTKALKKETSSKKTVVKAKKPIASKVKTTQKTLKISKKSKSPLKTDSKVENNSTSNKKASSTVKKSPTAGKNLPVAKASLTNKPAAKKVQVAKHTTLVKKITGKQISPTLGGKPKQPSDMAKPLKPTKTNQKTKKAPSQLDFLRKTGQLTGGPVGFSPYTLKSSEAYMNEFQLAHFQHILHLWKQQILSDRDVITQNLRNDNTINFPDPLDRAALEEEHTLEWRAREREHRVILKIDQALGRIKHKEYGYCESCGSEIGIQRLEARPTATQCIDCKTINEMRERHTGSIE